jgi:hypothetical protein
MMTNTGRSIAAAEGQKGTKIVRWTRKGLLWSVATLLALAVAGAAYQIVVTVIDQRSVAPAHGEMVSVGDHQLHINCVGQGSPTVILEAGWAFTSIEWSDYVQPDVAKHTRACSYDRAGLAWSDPGPSPRNATRR